VAQAIRLRCLPQRRFPPRHVRIGSEADLLVNLFAGGFKSANPELMARPHLAYPKREASSSVFSDTVLDAVLASIPRYEQRSTPKL